MIWVVGLQQHARMAWENSPSAKWNRNSPWSRYGIAASGQLSGFTQSAGVQFPHARPVARSPAGRGRARRGAIHKSRSRVSGVSGALGMITMPSSET